MTHLEEELIGIKQSLSDLFELVFNQLQKSKTALMKLDKDLAREIRVNEKRVNAYELKIDRDCENAIALFNPVAIDLRFVLASLKINSHLERIGDIAEGIANYVLDLKLEPQAELLQSTRLLEMFDLSLSILETTKQAFETEDTSLARSVFLKDELLDEINIAATDTVADFIKANPESIRSALYAISTISKL